MPHCWVGTRDPSLIRSLYPLATISHPDNIQMILDPHDIETVSVWIFTRVSRISRCFLGSSISSVLGPEDAASQVRTLWSQSFMFSSKCRSHLSLFVHFGVTSFNRIANIDYIPCLDSEKIFPPHTHVLFLDSYPQTATLTPKTALGMPSYVLKAHNLHSDKVLGCRQKCALRYHEADIEVLEDFLYTAAQRRTTATRGVSSGQHSYYYSQHHILRDTLLTLKQSLFEHQGFDPS